MIFLIPNYIINSGFKSDANGPVAEHKHISLNAE